MDASLGATRTVAEVNCQLCDVDVGTQRLSVPACPDVFVRPEAASNFDAATVTVRSPSGAWPRGHRGDDDGAAPLNPLAALARPALDQLSAINTRVGALLSSRSSSPTAAAHPAPLAWHPSRPILAAVDAANGVPIFDFSESVPYLGQSRSTPPSALAPVGAFTHELQAGARAGAAAWRPGPGLALAVGCARGACLWRLSSPSSTAQGASLTWLQAPGEAPVSALAWHPRGHLLAAASPARPGLFVWDVATGAVTTVRAGLETVSLLAWSPCGAYLLAAGAGSGGGFRLFETAGWRSAKWTVGGGDAGELVSAAWAPSGRTLLLAHRSQVSALHLTAEPPALTAQVLPVPLAGVDAGSLIQGMAWDPRGQRLAAALGGSGSKSGTAVAVYDTRCDPILTARLIGKARIVPMNGGEGPDDADWEIVEAEEAGSGVGGVAAAAAGESAERPSLAFMPGFAQGAVLAVRQGDFVGTLPMYF